VYWYAGFGGSCIISLQPGDTFNNRTPGNGGKWTMTVEDGKIVAKKAHTAG
jgi:hypothetical protein